MGREVRKVKADWQHPRDEKTGHYRPLFDGSDYERRKKKWLDSLSEKGLQETLDYHGNPPNREDYMPVWTDEEKTHLMMYEDTSEGTPVSPAFKEPEALARWLADNNASAFGGMTASYEQWLAMIGDGFCVSMVVDSHGLRSGVEFAAER